MGLAGIASDNLLNPTQTGVNWPWSWSLCSVTVSRQLFHRPLLMPLGGSLSWLHYVTIQSVPDCIGWHICICLAQSKRTWSSHHISGVLGVALLILLVIALVGILDFHPVLSKLIISKCWVDKPALSGVCYPPLIQVCSLSLVWLSIASFSEFAWHFISWHSDYNSPHNLADCWRSPPRSPLWLNCS